MLQSTTMTKTITNNTKNTNKKKGKEHFNVTDNIAFVLVVILRL